jgi:hypothetical protein
MVHEILAVPEARFRSHHGWGCILGKVARPRCYSKANKYHKKRLFLCPRTFPITGILVPMTERSGHANGLSDWQQVRPG